jgi:hypothetical protein
MSCNISVEENDKTIGHLEKDEWLKNEQRMIAEKRQTEERVVTRHTEALKKGVPDTAEVTKTGGRRTKIESV